MYICGHNVRKIGKVQVSLKLRLEYTNKLIKTA